MKFKVIIDRSELKKLRCSLLMVVLIIILTMAAVPIAVADVTWSNDAINYRDNYLGPPDYCILTGAGWPSPYWAPVFNALVTNATRNATATDGVVDVEDLEWAMAQYMVALMRWTWEAAYGNLTLWETACGWPPGTILQVEPSYIEVSEPGVNFLVNVTITNVTSLWGYEFKLGFDTAILNVTGSVEGENATKVTPGAFNPVGAMYGPMKIIQGVPTWAPLQNVTDGFVWAGAALPAAKSGSGVLMTINFTALAPGNSTLHLYDTEVVDSCGIRHRWHDGLVNVIPEFPATLILPLFLFLTLIAVTLAKKIRCKITAKNYLNPHLLSLNEDYLLTNNQRVSRNACRVS